MVAELWAVVLVVLCVFGLWIGAWFEEWPGDDER